MSIQPSPRVAPVHADSAGEIRLTLTLPPIAQARFGGYVNLFK